MKLKDLIAARDPEIELEIEMDNTCGGFEVFVNGKVVVSLLDMPRPFNKLRALNLEGVADAVVAACEENPRVENLSE